MKTTPDCYQVLLNEKWLIHVDSPYRVHFASGKLVDKDGEQSYENFISPEKWKIYEPPKWYENIPVGDMLCQTSAGMRAISYYSKNHAQYVFREENGVGHTKAVPIHKPQIQIWLDNAPEE